MNMKPIVAVAIALTVGIVTFSGVLIPAIESGVDTKDTFTNEGRYYVTTEIEDDVTITMNYDIENNVRQWYIDDVLLEYNRISNVPEYVSTPTVVGTDNYVVRTDGRTRGISTNTGSSDYTVTVTNESITSGNSVGNAPLFVASTSKTDYIMRYSPATTNYILGSSEIIGCGYTGNITIGNDSMVDVVISFTGSVKDGVEITTYNPTYTFSVSNVKINADKVAGYVDLYKFNSVTFDVTYNDGTTDYVTPCTYSIVVLPAEVTAEKSIHADASTILLFQTIPVFIVLGMIVAVVGVLYMKTRR